MVEVTQEKDLKAIEKGMENLEVEQNLKIIEKELQDLFLATTSDLSKIPRVAVEEKGKYNIHQLNDGNKMSVIIEATFDDLVPDNFLYFIENWAACSPALNPLIKSAVELEPIQGYNVGKAIADVPWPLWKRITISARYPIVNFRDSEHLFVLSERGAESSIKQNFSEEEAKDHVLAQLFVAGWHFAPVRSSEGEVVGSRVLYLICADAGGAIPQVVQDMVGPKQATQVVKNLYAFIKKREVEKSANDFLANITDLSSVFAEVQKQFDSKQDILKGKITDEVKQELYALSQQGSIGDVNTERPGFYQISARPLWDAWSSKKGMSKNDAMSSYIKIVKTYI